MSLVLRSDVRRIRCDQVETTKLGQEGGLSWPFSMEGQAADGEHLNRCE